MDVPSVISVNNNNLQAVRRKGGLLAAVELCGATVPVSPTRRPIFPGCDDCMRAGYVLCGSGKELTPKAQGLSGALLLSLGMARKAPTLVSSSTGKRGRRRARRASAALR